MKNLLAASVVALSAVPAWAVAPWAESEGADYSVRRGALTPMISYGLSGSTQLGGQLDFMNTISDFSLAVRVAKNKTLTEYGATLRAYLPFWTTGDLRFYAGIGGSGLSSKGDSSASPQRPYWDIAVSPVVRVLYAPIDTFGLMLETGMDGRFYRIYTDKNSQPTLKHTDSQFRSNVYVALGLSIAVN